MLAATAAAQTSAPLIEQHGGAYLPTHGTVRGLVLCVQMSNDTRGNEAWPLGGMPQWIDAYTARLHQYFADMSGGALDLRLDVHPTPLLSLASELEYIARGQKYGQAIKEILEGLDTQIDFAPYDQWSPSQNDYRPLPGPDGQVDLIIVLFRSISEGGFNPFVGVSDLGFKGYLFVDGTLDRFIYGGTSQFNDASSSGLSICAAPGTCTVLDADYAFKVSLHELGHKFLGEAHPADVYGGLGLMGRSGNGLAMNSYERHCAGYARYRELVPMRDTVFTLRDAVTTGDACLLPVPQAPRSYYAFEFRSRQSEWDGAPTRGLYVLRLYDAWSRSMKSALLVSAEGAFRWERDTVHGGIRQVAPDPIGGYNRFQRIPIDGTIYWADGYWGDPSAAFTPERAELAVWKNPSPDFIFGIDTVRTEIRMRVLSMNSTSVTVRLTFNDPPILGADAPAAAPASPEIESVHPHPLLRGVTGWVTYTLPAAADATLELCDALGRRMAVLDASQRAAGTHRVALPTTGLASGAWHLVLRAAGRVAHRSFLLTD